MRPKILFLPNYLGGGFGHIGRCLAMAEKWRSRGGEAALVVSGRQAQRVIDAGIAVETPKIMAVAPKVAGAPAYVYIPDMSYQVVRDGFDHPYRVWKALKELESILARFKPDVLVGDGHLLTGMVGRKVGLPVAQIVKSMAHPLINKLIDYWEPVPPGLVLPDIRPVFNPVLRFLRQPEIEWAAQLLVGDLYLMASGLPDLDPLDQIPDRTYWPGPLLRQKEAIGGDVDWMDHLPAGRPVIYITIGGATSLGSWGRLINLLFNALDGRPYTVVLSTGGRTDLIGQTPGALPVPANFVVRSWVPTRQMLRRCQAAIFHGGYTRLEVLMEGCPSVVLPGHSEQAYYGRVMARAGAARLLSLNEGPLVPHKGHWRAGRWIGGQDFTIFVRNEITLQPELLCQAVEQAVEDPEIRQRTNFLRCELEKTGGCEAALDYIEALVM